MARKKVALDFEQSLADLQTLVERLKTKPVKWRVVPGPTA